METQSTILNEYMKKRVIKSRFVAFDLQDLKGDKPCLPPALEKGENEMYPQPPPIKKVVPPKLVINLSKLTEIRVDYQLYTTKS